MVEQATKPVSIPPTWDLSQLFASEEALIEEIKKVEEATDRFKRFKEVKLTDWTSETLAKSAIEYNDIMARISVMRSFIQATTDQDTSNSNFQAFFRRHVNKLDQIEDEYSFYRFLFRHISQEIIDQTFPEGELHHFIVRRKKMAQHNLDEEMEKKLTAQYSSKVYEWRGMANAIITNIMVSFEDEKNKLITAPIRESGRFLSNTNPEVRERFLVARNQKYQDYYSMLEPIFSKIVKDRHHELCKLRGYPTSLSLICFNEKIEEEWLIELMNAMSSETTIFHESLLFRKKIFSLGNSYAHLNGWSKEPTKVDLTHEDCLKLTKEAFERFSPEWKNIIDEMQKNKRIDMRYSPFKRSTGTCFKIPNQESLVTINGANWSLTAHELGHAIHNHYRKNKKYLISGCGNAVAETASQFSERIAYDVFLEQYRQDPADRALSLDRDIIGRQSTLFWNFLFTEFELKAHESILNNEPFEKIHEQYYQTMKKLYGNSFSFPVEMKQGYLFNQDVYQRPFTNVTYGLGLMAATIIKHNFQEDPEKTVSAYNEMLTFGETRSTMDHFKTVGIPTNPKKMVQKTVTCLRKELDELKSQDWSFLKE